ncbi:hypothetical protein GCM10018980_71270 [Streptomyces capoamus]|uniref:Insertion element IS402-like domain-containing protein n=1 Tax=Streptomyces capoamus TaxID=68183 RepID=A0A919F369_9ACTN|nr:hypothetical protein GCM10018980_71270 [Streptomyces capoamus]
MWWAFACGGSLRALPNTGAPVARDGMLCAAVFSPEEYDAVLVRRSRSGPLPGTRLRAGLAPIDGALPWEYLPQDLGLGSGMTCWRRLRDWNEAGVWQRLHKVLLAELNAASRMDWSRCVVDSSHVKAKKGAAHGPVAGRPGPGRLQAPPDHRRARHPAHSPADRRQPH